VPQATFGCFDGRIDHPEIRPGPEGLEEPIGGAGAGQGRQPLLGPVGDPLIAVALRGAVAELEFVVERRRIVVP